MKWVILFAVVLFSCSKKTNFRDNTAKFTAALKTQSNDAVRLSNELDALFNDVDSILENRTAVCGGAFGIDLADTPNVMAIAYDTNSCDALRRLSGQVNVSFAPGTDFSTANDTVVVSLSNITITRLADSSTMIFNGSFTYVNNSGGKLAGLSSGGANIVHTIYGPGVTVTYDNQFASRWQFSRQRTYTYNQGIVVSTIGLDSAGTVGNVADWGANRFGNSVIIVPTAALQMNQGCGWRTTGGQVTLSNPTGATTISLGLDSTGKAAGCPLPGNPFYYQLSWTGDGESPFTTLLPY